jgi:hypothetical protein
VSVRREFGAGPLARAVALVYALLVVEVLLVVTTLPGLVPLLLLDRDASNLPLAAACLLPVGPAVSAALFAVHRHHGDLTDLHPGRAFWRGYRLNVAGVLRIWVPALVWLTIIAMTVTHLPAAGVPRWWTVPLVVVAVAVALWTANAIVISSLFAFRARDVARLAGYFLTRSPGGTLRTACLLVVAAAVTALTSDAVLALLGSVLVLLWLRASGAMIRTTREEFTQDPA